MFRCEVCPFESNELTRFVPHYRLHRNVANFHFPCVVASCRCSFRTYSAFVSHTYRQHINVAQVTPNRAVTRSGVLSLECHVQGINCTFTTCNLSKFLRHIKGHIDLGISITCPFDGCRKTFKVKSSFTSHVSRVHKGSTSKSISADIHALQHPDDVNLIQIDEQPDEVPMLNEAMSIDHQDESVDAIDIATAENNFLESLALFYLNLQAKVLLPASTIQLIIAEFQEIHNLGHAHLCRHMKQLLISLNIEPGVTSSILEELQRCDLLKDCNEGPLRTDATRKSFFKKNFNFIAPQQRYLGQNSSGVDRFYQYVPIKKSLQSLFKQSSVLQQHEEMKGRRASAGMFEDIHDGELIKRNALFSTDGDSLKIILYQDAFEVVNPLGSGKTKHKVLAVYMTLGNFMPHCRSSIDHIQLVLLAREKDFKYFGNEAVFNQLILDLHDLENNGIQINGGNVLKGSLCAIAGDNLGSHGIGSFSENFSTSVHFCRFCQVERPTFVENPLATGVRRTPETYNQSATDEAYCVKSQSCFNSLSYFHVAQPGLPPCLAHDLFEGVVSKDLALYLKYLIKVEKLFTYEYLNLQISEFKYLGSDALNKPASVHPKGDKLGGHAAQNWCLLRLLPIMICGKLQQYNECENKVWELCLNLRSIVELVCSPKISTNQIAVLKMTIEEYLQDRFELFPNDRLKPKHHYLLHYPELIMQFGPLIRLWTMRFESKHRFFKQCAAKLHNFKNLCSTLATRHQFLQAYLSHGSLFPPTVLFDNGSPLFIDTMSHEIKAAIEAFGFDETNTMSTFKVNYKGSEYCRGLVVALSHDADFGIIFGRIELLLIKEGKSVFLLVKKFKSIVLADLGMYSLTSLTPDEDDSVDTLICVAADALVDYYPLPIYQWNGLMLVSLHHSINCE